MARTRSAYPPEFRRQMVELVNAGRSPEELVREFEPTVQSIRNWVAQSGRDAGRGDGGLTTAEREELTRHRQDLIRCNARRARRHAAAPCCRDGRRRRRARSRRDRQAGTKKRPRSAEPRNVTCAPPDVTARNRHFQPTPNSGEAFLLRRNQTIRPPH